MSQSLDVFERYAAMAAAGDIADDAAQRRVAKCLAKLQQELENRRFATKASALGWLFAKRGREQPPKGLYIHGAVGRGKTMLMDLFFSAAPDLPKRRVHFHEFMAEVHERIHRWRVDARHGLVKGEDSVSPVADDIAAEARLLCFDEFHVTDIADAMILGRLFARLFGKGVIVVATSNFPPGQLYHNGLNRPLFLPFIDLLQERLDILHLDADVDYRLEKLVGQQVYFHPLGEAADKQMDAMWRRMTGAERGQPDSLKVKGRTLNVPQAAMGAARFSFADLCAQPLGANDFLKLARRYHTVFIDRIPPLDRGKREEARRFVNLIDTLYDSRVKLIVSAACEPASIYTAGEDADLFMRTASRLIEMRSGDYLEAGHGAGTAAAAGA